MSRLAAVATHVDHFQHRVIVDALNEATAAYWRRRAAQFRGVGNERCDLIARNCEHRATLAEEMDEPWISEALEDVFAGAA